MSFAPNEDRIEGGKQTNETFHILLFIFKELIYPDCKNDCRHELFLQKIIIEDCLCKNSVFTTQRACTLYLGNRYSL